MNISEEMVKYYLFKTRKILKEGVNMERKFGEKSYNPSTFHINFWGNGGNAYIWDTFQRRLPGNIVLAAYEKPVSIEELSLELGVSAPYLEDELDILVKYNFVKQVGSKYQTDFLIFTKSYEEEFQKVIPSNEICAETVRQISEGVENCLNSFRSKELGAKLDDNALRWFIINFALINALGEFEEKTNVCTYWMDLFQRSGNVWHRSYEEHREYAYSAQQLTGYLKDAGFTAIEVFGDRRLAAPAPGEQRIYLKARKGKIK